MMLRFIMALLFLSNQVQSRLFTNTYVDTHESEVDGTDEEEHRYGRFMSPSTTTTTTNDPLDSEHMSLDLQSTRPFPCKKITENKRKCVVISKKQYCKIVKIIVKIIC